MILSPQDKDIYFPTVCTEGANLLGAIRITESIAQSQEGSGRFLEITDYHVEKPLSAFDRSIRLDYYPVIPESLVVSTVRATGKDGFGRNVSIASRLLNPSEYQLKDGKLYLNSPEFIVYLAVDYKAGYDFLEETPDTIAIKSALGALLQHRMSFAGQGLTRHDGLGLSVNSAPVGTNPENIMQIFRQYRPYN